MDTESETVIQLEFISATGFTIEIDHHYFTPKFLRMGKRTTKKERKKD